TSSVARWISRLTSNPPLMTLRVSGRAALPAAPPESFNTAADATPSAYHASPCMGAPPLMLLNRDMVAIPFIRSVAQSWTQGHNAACRPPAPGLPTPAAHARLSTASTALGIPRTVRSHDPRPDRHPAEEPAVERQLDLPVAAMRIAG